MERRVLIVNPISGKGKSIEIAHVLEEKFKYDKLDYKLLYTQKKEDATNFVKHFTRPNDIIYSIGGDGTLNEVVNGIVGLDRKLCVIPTGSGNDFYKTIKEYDQSCKVDIGCVNDKYFINSFSIGIDADICNNTYIFRKKFIPSSMIYNLSIIYTLLGYESKNMKIENNEQDCTLVSITNGKYYGGGFKINPEAIIDDGLLDMIIVDKTSKIKMISMLLKLLSATHLTLDGVHASKVKNIVINSNKELLACIDGEMIRSNEYRIGIIPKAIELYKDDSLDIKRLIRK